MIGSNKLTTLTDYRDFDDKIRAILPRIATFTEREWRNMGCPTADEFLMFTRKLDWSTAMKYPSMTGWDLAKMRQEKAEAESASGIEKRGRGRPKGSKNKPKRPERRGPGRPR